MQNLRGHWKLKNEFNVYQGVENNSCESIKKVHRRRWQDALTESDGYFLRKSFEINAIAFMQN